MKIRICKGKTCSWKFSKYITERLKQDIEKIKIEWVEIEETPCMGRCKSAPNVNFDKEEMIYADPIKASKRLLWTKNNKTNNKK